MAPTDARWMALALGLARRGRGRVAPNPTVGAAIVAGHGAEAVLLGRGATAEGGRPHAETVAIAQACERYGAQAVRGATAYVTLEPCAHHGLTPPCADALVEAGIARVVCPLQDPDPRVSGRGFERLRTAGVAVEIGPMAEEARAINAGFLSLQERGRPWLTLKLATTLDGRIATGTGESRWITGEAARRRVHAMRAQADAVLVGSGTALADDPLLDVRGLGSRVHQPVRAVIDGALALPLDGRLAASARAVPVWVLHRDNADAGRRAALEATGVRPIPLAPGADGRLPMAGALEALAGLGVTRVLCEGGGRLAAALLGAGLVDEIALFQAGRVIGADGVAAVAGFGLERLGEAPAFARVSLEALGGDVLSLWRRA